MRILDLFCGGGGASMGYHQAGYEVVGADMAPQPLYPFEFHQCDWEKMLDSSWQEFDVIHASPPCQGYSITKSLSKSTQPLLIGQVRSALIATGKPYVIENVPGAKQHMRNPVTLRGNMFPGLRVIRDRLFESNLPLPQPLLLSPGGTTNSHRGLSTGGDWITVAGHNFLVSEARLAMGIDWMGQKGLAQAIPPAYTKWIGEQLLILLDSHPENRGCKNPLN